MNTDNPVVEAEVVLLARIVKKGYAAPTIQDAMEDVLVLISREISNLPTILIPDQLKTLARVLEENKIAITLAIININAEAEEKPFESDDEDDDAADVRY